MAVTYTHSGVVLTPCGDKPRRERVPVRHNGRIWVDWKRRQYCPDTGARMSTPHTNNSVLLLETIRERTP